MLSSPIVRTGWAPDGFGPEGVGSTREPWKSIRCAPLAAVAADVALAAVSAPVAWAASRTRPSFALLTSAPVIVPFLIFAEVTASFFSCLVPTLFGGRWVAAYAPPPSATKTAMVAITLAYVRRG